MIRRCAPGLALLSACYYVRRDESLGPLAEPPVPSSISCVETQVNAADRPAVVCDVEFVRVYAGGGAWRWRIEVACDFLAQRRVACANVPLAMEYPAMGEWVRVIDARVGEWVWEDRGTAGEDRGRRVRLRAAQRNRIGSYRPAAL